MEKQEQQHYRCRNCRAKLFDQPKHGLAECTSLFIDAPTWLPEPEQNQVKLFCPKCKVKIGDVVWSGKKCSCLAWVTPAVQVHRNKIDHMKPLGLAHK